MKKNLLFVVALMACLSLSAGEVGKIDTLALGLTSTASALTAGTIVAQTASVTMSIAFDDNYKAVSIVANDYTAISVDGNQFFSGIQGSTNPKDVNGSAPNNSLSVPVGGAAFKLDVSADGYIYILHKASSHKSYTIFENGSAIGYDFAMNTANDFLGSVYKYTLAGEGEFNYIPAGDTIFWAETYATGYKDYIATNALTQIGASGMSYIKFPVFKDCSYIVNACGSKMTCAGFYFDAAGTAGVELIGETNLTMEAGVVEPTTSTVTFIVDDSANKTGTDFKLRGSWIGATGVYDSSWDGGADHTSFYDDGTNGDVTAGDHIWTVAVQLVPDATVTWKWGFMMDGSWGVVGSDREFTLTDTAGQTETYTIPSTEGVDDIKSAKTVIKTEYYSINGAKLNGPVNGVNIIRRIMSDGSIENKKAIIHK